MIFLDTNIVIYALGVQEEKKRIAAECLEQAYCISIQVLNESRNILTRKLKLNVDHCQKSLDFIASEVETLALQLADFQLSWDLMRKYQFSHWDSLIVAHALRNQGSVLYSEDMHSGLVVENQLKIVSPF